MRNIDIEMMSYDIHLEINLIVNKNNNFKSD